MSCSKGRDKAASSAKASGVSNEASKGSHLAGHSAQVTPFTSPATTKKRGKRRPRAKTTSAGKKKSRKGKVDQGNVKTASRPGAQASFFETVQSGVRSLPTQRQIRLADHFSPEELQQISVQLGLGAAAASRHISVLTSETSRGIGHTDPRPLDWARLDQQNFQFLAGQVAKIRRRGGLLETSSLTKAELFDLWEFANFEADRALRNIDHLASGSSHLKGPTADYLTGQHKLAARFYTVLAGRLEPLITPEMMDRYYVGL